VKQRSIRIIAEFLARRPIARIVSVRPLGDDHYSVSLEDRRDGREHVLENCEDLARWLISVKQGRCDRPAKGYCDCCNRLHTDHDTYGELFDLCIGCQAELTALAFEKPGEGT
jgi:hypothetical protein